MPRCKTHYSRKAARRVLDALMRLGGKGTTAQIAEITGGCATHSDVHSLRTWLREEHGYSHDDALNAVRTLRLGFNASGHNVFRYALREDVKALHRKVRQGTGPLTPLRVLSPSTARPLQRQGGLFETRSTAIRRRHL